MRNFNYSLINLNGDTLYLINKIYEHKGKFDYFILTKGGDLKVLINQTKNASAIASCRKSGERVKESRLKFLLNEKVQPKTSDEAQILGYRYLLNLIYDEYDSIDFTLNNVIKVYNIIFGFRKKNSFRVDKSYFNSDTKEDASLVIKEKDKIEMLEKAINNYNEALENNQNSPLLLIPTFFNDFMQINPFMENTTIVIKALLSLLLFKSGFIVNKYISLDEKIDKTKQMLTLSINCGKLGWDTEKENKDPIIKYLLNKINDSYTEFEETYESEVFNKSATEQVNEALNKLSNTFTKHELMELCPTLSSSSVEKQIARLSRESLIEKHINGKSSYYTKL